jgi:hypothetical protein
MKRKTENVLKDFFDLELPSFKPAKKPESVFDSKIAKTFNFVDKLANSILFKTPKLKAPKLAREVKVKKSYGAKSSKSVKEKSVKKQRKLRRPRVLKIADYQTGKRASLRLDRKRKALPPGKRISKSGKVYWETRRNRSDLRKGI